MNFSHHFRFSSLCALVPIFFIVAGCANAQPNPDVPPQPQPEAQPEFVPVAPAPFHQTVWREGARGRLKISGPLEKYQGALEVFDFSGKSVWKENVAANASEIEIPVSRVGLYSLRAGTQTLSFSVVPVPPQNQRTNRMLIGLCTHFGPRETPDENYRVLQAAGVDAVRDEMAWGAHEKEPGVFNFIPRHLEYTAKLKEHGISLHWSASYGNPLYPRVENRYPAAAAAEPYARHIVEVLKKFGDNIIAVEILNEPNKVAPVKDYLPVLQAAHRAVRAAGFKQPIVAIGGAGPAGGGMAPGYARAVFGAGGAASTDGFSTHPYMTPFPPDTGYGNVNGPSNLDVALTRAGDVVEKFKLQGSWITELGWPGIEAGQNPTPEQWEDNRSARPMVSEPKQAAFTARTLLIGAQYSHLKGIFIYDYKDDGPIPLRREHRFGLVRQDLQPKMGFQAFTIAMNFLRDKTFVRNFHAPDSFLRGALFRDLSGELWLAAWTTEITTNDMNAVIALKKTDPKASLPRRHMENENHVRFRVGAGREYSGYDWQGAPLSKNTRWTATSLPMYLRVGRDEKSIELHTLEVLKIKIGTLGEAEASVVIP